MNKNKKGLEMKEYPKLIKVGEKKVRVLNKEEEDKALNKQPEIKSDTKKDDKKSASWGR